MGFLTDLFRGKLPGFTKPLMAPPTALGSPNAASLAQKLVWQDYFKGELDIADRRSAMQVGAIAKARSVIVGILAGQPLRAYQGIPDELLDDPLADIDEYRISLPWLRTTKSDLPVWHRTAWTIDDWLFYGESLWAAERDGAGAIVDVARVPFERWSVDSGSGVILVDSEPVNASEIIYLPGPFEGILSTAQDTITGARATDRAWIGRVQNPIPIMELHQLTDDELDDEEVDELVDTWAAGRTSPNGAVGFTDHRVELRTHGEAKTDLFVEGRNANVLDVARHTTIPAALLDGSMTTASLTYSTSEGKRSELLDFSIRYWAGPLESRLSMDDVVPENVTVRFDMRGITMVPTQPVQNQVNE